MTLPTPSRCAGVRRQHGAATADGSWRRQRAHACTCVAAQLRPPRPTPWHCTDPSRPGGGSHRGHVPLNLCASLRRWWAARGWQRRCSCPGPSRCIGRSCNTAARARRRSLRSGHRPTRRATARAGEPLRCGAAAPWRACLAPLLHAPALTSLPVPVQAEQSGRRERAAHGGQEQLPASPRDVDRLLQRHPWPTF